MDFGEAQAPAQRRGPKPRWSDAVLLEQIRAVLAASPFLGEGHRKVWARRRQGCGRPKRVLRLMREARLLAPTRVGRAHGPAAHDGTITTDAPDQMWGMDATSCLTRQEGTATVFVVVDHCASRVYRDPRREAGHALRGGGAAAARACARSLAATRRNCHGVAGPARSREPVREGLLSRRADVSRHHGQPGLRPGARRQWGRRALHSNAERTGPVGAPVSTPWRSCGSRCLTSRSGTIASGSVSGTGIRRRGRCGPKGRMSGRCLRSGLTMAPGSTISVGAAISLSPLKARSARVTINPVSIKSGAVQSVPRRC